MFIAVTRIKAPRQAQARIVEGFRQGGPHLKRFPGFIGLDLWTNDETLEAVSRWESREAMETYRNSPMFGQHHAGGTSDNAETVSFDAETVV